MEIRSIAIRFGSADEETVSRFGSHVGSEIDLIDANPGAFTDEDLVRDSQRMLAADYMKDANGVVGTQNLETWSGFSGFLFDNGLLAGPDGKPLTQKPDWSEYFTNEYLDAS